MMNNNQKIKHVVFTNKAKCRDCNRCVRVCPVNAIKIENSQAQVIPERCIDCGTCVIECPQKAKIYLHSLHSVLNWLEKGEKIAVSIAPSFASVYDDWERSRLPSALRAAGFSYIAETSTGAYQVAHHTKKLIESKPNATHICSSCPVIVSYVEKYAPKQLDQLLPIVSPMHIHARMLKEKLRGYKVVFIGPCIAKIRESMKEDVAKYVDAALTFENLNELFQKRKTSLDCCDISDFDERAGKDSLVFPLEGGILKTARLDSGFMNENIISVSGSAEVIDAINNANCDDEKFLIEPLFCKHGCINGPAIPNKKNHFANRAKIIRYNNLNNNKKEVELIASEKMTRKFSIDTPNTIENFSDDDIYKILKKTGKANTEDELNCGACGYDSCRLKAKAVLQGIAEEAMCIPYMRQIAEQKNNILLRNDPNGVIFLNDKLQITYLNPSFKKMFFCSDQLIGRPLSYLIDTAPFEKLISEKQQVVKVEIKYPNYRINCHQICYRLQEENLYIGIFVDITNFRINEEKLKSIKKDTILQANELLEHQVKMAQEFAHSLGESSAKGEMLLEKLINAIDN